MGHTYTAFMVNKVELSVNDAYKNYTENQCGLLLKALRKDTFAHLQKDPRKKDVDQTVILDILNDIPGNVVGIKGKKQIRIHGVIGIKDPIRIRGGRFHGRGLVCSFIRGLIRSLIRSRSIFVGRLITCLRRRLIGRLVGRFIGRGGILIGGLVRGARFGVGRRIGRNVGNVGAIGHICGFRHIGVGFGYVNVKELILRSNHADCIVINAVDSIKISVYKSRR